LEFASKEARRNVGKMPLMIQFVMIQFGKIQNKTSARETTKIKGFDI